MRVSFGDGAAAEYAPVVGADSINSDVRRLAFGEASPAYAGQMAWRSLAPVRPHSLDGVQFELGEDRFFGLCPIGNELTYGFGNFACARRDESAGGCVRRLREYFAGFGEPVQQYLAAVPFPGAAGRQVLHQVARHVDAQASCPGGRP